MIRRFRSASACAALVSICAGCAVFSTAPETETLPEKAPEVVEVYRRADGERARRLELEVLRLREDLREAEAAMVAIESGLRGDLSRADAVSALAESRITVERAAGDAPWRTESLREARQKLAEADRQLQAEHTGSAIFFASRARRIAEAVKEEALRLANDPGTRFIHGRRVNLRSGPSTADPVVRVLSDATPVFSERREGDWVLVRTATGMVGWVHRSLLRASRSASSATTTQSLPASLAR